MSRVCVRGPDQFMVSLLPRRWRANGAPSSAPETPAQSALTRDLEWLTERYPMPAQSARERPVFILSAGWRSGSTALQRLILSSGQTIVWGEPYEAEGLTHHLVETLRAVAHRPEKKNSFVQSLPPVDQLADQWVATFGPPVADLVAAQRALFTRLFGARPEYEGLRWGMKTVRLTPEYALYFRLLFPDASILFLVRDPFEAYASFHGSRFLRAAPDDYVKTAADFATHWVACAEQLKPAAQQASGLIVRYETLREPATIDAVEAATALTLPRNALSQIGSTGKSYAALPRGDRATFERIVTPVADAFGYHAP